MIDLEYFVGEECDIIIDKARLVSEAADESDKRIKSKVKAFIDKVSKFLKKLLEWLDKKFRNIIKKIKVLLGKKNKDLDENDEIRIPNWYEINVDKMMDLLKPVTDKLKDIIRNFLSNGTQTPLDDMEETKKVFTDFVKSQTSETNQIELVIRVGDIENLVKHIHAEHDRVVTAADSLKEILDKMHKIQNSANPNNFFYIMSITTVVGTLASEVSSVARGTIMANDSALFRAYTTRPEMVSYSLKHPYPFKESFDNGNDLFDWN